jgi:hypothetical protein
MFVGPALESGSSSTGSSAYVGPDLNLHAVEGRELSKGGSGQDRAEDVAFRISIRSVMSLENTG